MKNMKTIKYVLLGLITLFTIPAFGSEVQITTNNNSDSDDSEVQITTNNNSDSDSDSDSDLLTISLYSGIGNEFDVNLGGQPGIGTELMYNNFSVNLGIGRYHDYFGNYYFGNSIGVKVYKSVANSKNKVFAGFNYLRFCPLYSGNRNPIPDIVDDIKTGYYYYANVITVGCRHDFSNGIYVSPYAGETLTGMLCFGVNTGYQFKPIHLN